MNKSTSLPDPIAEPDPAMTSRVGFELVNDRHCKTLELAVKELRQVMPLTKPER